MKTEILDAKEMQRQYLREWRKKHPEKVKKYNREYWERRAKKAAMESEGSDDGKNE